jgi:hypothetical protein
MLRMWLMCGLTSACSVVDPSDEDKIRDAIGSLSPEKRERLRLLQRRLDSCQILALKIHEMQDDLYFTCYDGKEGASVNFGPNAAHDLCSNWDGEGRLRDHMKQAARDFIQKTTQIDFATCIPTEGGEEVFAEIEADYPETDSLARVIELLLLGVIPAAVLTVVAPELLPVLCVLGRDIYCADDGTLLPPGPLPIDPSPPPAPDAP